MTSLNTEEGKTGGVTTGEEIEGKTEL